MARTKRTRPPSDFRIVLWVLIAYLPMIPVGRMRRSRIKMA
jgi:hypothetical protein